MRNIFKSVTALAAAGVLTLTGTAFNIQNGSPVNLKASAADDNNDDWLHAEGSCLYDMNGNQVWLVRYELYRERAPRSLCERC